MTMRVTGISLTVATVACLACSGSGPIVNPDEDAGAGGSGGGIVGAAGGLGGTSGGVAGGTSGGTSGGVAGGMSGGSSGGSSGGASGGAVAGGSGGGSAIDAGRDAGADAGVWRCDGGFCLQPQQGDGGQSLNSIWGAGAGDIWAVGDDGLCVHWDGARWTPVATGTSASLRSVWGTATDDVWAVGTEGTALHWDGTAWARFDSSTDAGLSSVWAASRTDAWAVGYNRVVVRWSGTSWSKPDAGFATNPNGFLTVWGSGPNDVWLSALNELHHYNGTFWNTVPLGPDMFGRSVWLAAITGTGPNDVWTAGWNFSSPPFTESWHWNGSQWRFIIGASSGVSTASLNSAWAISPSDVWTVGYEQPQISNPSFAAHWDGGRWGTVPVPVYVTLNGVWASGPNDVWAVGQRGTILHWP